MRQAASVLGLIGGLIGILVGLFGYGATEIAARAPELSLIDNPQVVRVASFFAPLFAIAGGAMAKDRALWGGLLMLAAAVAFYTAFGFNVGTMFPIGFTGLGGVLAVLSRRPDEPRAH